MASLALFAAGLLFRAFAYHRLPLPPGQPHGIADVVELLLAGALLAVLAASAVCAAVLAVRGPRPNRRAAAWLAGLVAALLLAFGPLHAAVARVAAM